MNDAIEFAKWIGDCQFTKHQCNDRWYDEDSYIGTTKDLWDRFKAKNESII